MKRKITISLMLITLVLFIVGGAKVEYDKNNNKDSSAIEKSKSTTSSKKSDEISLVGIFYSSSGETADIQSVGENKWEITYSTSDGNVTGDFKTKWQKVGKLYKSTSLMEKSDGYSGFKVSVEYETPENIAITMSDGNVSHQMVFTKEKPATNAKYTAVLKGDLSAFEGQFSDDTFNKTITDSGFTYGGYSPEDYYNNQTTVFPAIRENGYWNGITSHGNFEVKSSDLPKQVNGYYEVHVYGANSGANNATLTFFLVPPKVKGPDGTVSDEKRVFQKDADGKPHLLEYQEPQWWKKYQDISTLTS